LIDRYGLAMLGTASSTAERKNSARCSIADGAICAQ
jgi:hypothetical protein